MKRGVGLYCIWLSLLVSADKVYGTKDMERGELRPPWQGSEPCRFYWPSLNPPGHLHQGEIGVVMPNYSSALSCSVSHM